MNKKGKSMLKEIVIGVLILIIVAVLIGGGNIRGIFSHPEPVLIFPTDNGVCPSSIYFNNNLLWQFKISIRNSGGEGNIFVNASAKDALVRNDQISNFDNTSLRVWNIPAGLSGDFNFQFNRTNSYQENLSVHFIYGCESVFCHKYLLDCDYTLQSGSLDQYDLIK